MIPLTPFLSAYDPSDLPGQSIDPLGFERGYLHLAEKILPGLTNVASRPRYFGVLCAGISLSKASEPDSPRAQYQRRLETVLRLERLWGLANVLVRDEQGEDAFPVGGIRGLRYVERRAREVVSRGDTRTSADFKVLIRQATYGVIGIYAAAAERLRLLVDRKSLSLTPDLGGRIADAFIAETEMPGEVMAAVQYDRDVAVRRLIQWGEAAHVSAEPGQVEAKCLGEALHSNAVRSRMVEVLAQHPLTDSEEEMDRLERVRPALQRDDINRDLAEAVSAIVAFERAYALAQLVLERLLWLARGQATVSQFAAASDPVVARSRRLLPAAAARLDDALCGASTEHLRRDEHRVEDARCFVHDLAHAADEPGEFLRRVLRRHADVQHGKFDRGRRKAPWVELEGDSIRLTTARAGGAGFEVQTEAQIIPHYYRTAAADALHEASLAVAVA